MWDFSAVRAESRAAGPTLRGLGHLSNGPKALKFSHTPPLFWHPSARCLCHARRCAPDQFAHLAGAFQ